MRNVFSTYHPLINFGFFCGVIGIGIFMIHPVFLGMGTAGALAYVLILEGKKKLKFILGFLLPMTIVITIVNPLVNHRGSTILYETENTYFTLEAAVYGLMLGMMLASILLWFSCYNIIMTSDKFIYLFGRILPAISLVFSMVMRFIPNYKIQITKISNAQKCIGRDAGSGTVKEKIRHGMRIVSIMFTWALENSIDSADSMRSRGYGLAGRSTFSIYRFDRRDAFTAAFLLCMVLIVIAGGIAGVCSVEYYPEIVFAKVGPASVCVYMAFFCLCFFPAAVEGKERLLWRHLQSEI